MSCFFSSTDAQELHDNGPNYNYYLSLIVNFKGEYCAKIAFVSKYQFKTAKTGSLTFKGSEGKDITLNLKNADEDINKDVLCLVDFDIEIEREVDQFSEFVENQGKLVFKTLEDHLKSKEYTGGLDEKFLENITKAIKSNISSADLQVDEFTKERYESLKKTKHTPKPYYSGYSKDHVGAVSNQRSLYDDKSYEAYDDYYENKYTPVNSTNKNFQEYNKSNNTMRPIRDLGKDTKKGTKLQPWELDNYLTKLLSLDSIAEGTLQQTLKTLTKDTVGKNIDMLLYHIEEDIISMYKKVFDIKIPHDDDVEQLVIDCISRLKLWERDFTVATDLIEMFAKYLVGDVSKEQGDEKTQKESAWTKLKRIL